MHAIRILGVIVGILGAGPGCGAEGPSKSKIFKQNGVIVDANAFFTAAVAGKKAIEVVQPGVAGRALVTVDGNVFLFGNAG